MSNRACVPIILSLSRLAGADNNKNNKIYMFTVRILYLQTSIEI